MHIQLPNELDERTRLHQSGPFEGEFVLYWMRSAVRTKENPALDVAKHAAQQLDLPLLVYHAISQHYQYASDRHHLFMLQGARDVQAEFTQLGIGYAFHLATPNDAQPHLATLAAQAAVLITEEMPVDPPRRFLNALTRPTDDSSEKRVHAVDTPILCVDTACIVPMQRLNKAYTRAFQFRKATKKLYAERLTRLWPEYELSVASVSVDRLPFQPLDLQHADLMELVAQCEIDHSVGPVPDTTGGSTAGYQRWQTFKEKGLRSYANRRNNALVDGVSRMSAYLHYGMVSPMRIAREAADLDHAGSEKYLDELLIWRELAYNFCFFRQDHDQWSALPDWSRETLEAHARDRRDQVYSCEELARAQTADDLWNAAQLSLLRQGELHNNVRMTWGKAILEWTASPQQAMQFLFDLNHRYALDGRDPASYGGLLWCLGQFDRPFTPAKNVFGTVRPRSTRDHAKRLDVQQYTTKVASPRFGSQPKVAVIGAGISGLMAARTLADHGIPVDVFDKGRGVGGRMSSRRVDGVSTFDHGAQYFTARDPRFQRYVQSWEEQGIVAKWPAPQHDPSHQVVVFKNGKRTTKPDSHTRFVAVPSMNQICKHLATDLSVHTATRIDSIQLSNGSIQLGDASKEPLGSFDRLIISAPAEQSATLLSGVSQLSEAIATIEMHPCWAVMATLEQPLQNDWVGAFVHDSVVTWAARNGTKPGRPDGEHLLIHAGHQWTAENWERDPAEVANEILNAFWESSGLPAIATLHLQAHRWKFAIPVDPPPTRCYYDQDNGMVACGDWAGGPRVEGAFLSGMAAAGRVLGSIPLTKHQKSQGELF